MFSKLPSDDLVLALFDDILEAKMRKVPEGQVIDDAQEQALFAESRQVLLEVLDDLTPFRQPWERLSDVLLVFLVDRVIGAVDTKAERDELKARLAERVGNVRRRIREYRASKG